MLTHEKDDQCSPQADHVTSKDYRHQLGRDFNQELRRLHLRAGEPAMMEMEKISKATVGIQPLSHSTAHDLLKEGRTRISAWPIVLSFVTVCRIFAERTHGRPEQLPTVEEWRQRWYRAKSAVIDTAPLPVYAHDLTGVEAIEGESLPSRAMQQPLPVDARGDLPAADVPVDADPYAESTRRATMLALTRYASTMGWWHEHRDLVPEQSGTYLSLEPVACLIRSYETAQVPELLQTEDYARADIRLRHPEASATEIDRRIGLLTRRQQILHTSAATTCWVIIEKEALRRPAIPAPIMRAQLEYLINVGQQANIPLQVMTGSTQEPSCQGAAGGPVTILRFPERELPDVVYLPQHPGGLYPDRPNDIHHYTQLMDRLGIEAEKSAASMSILNRLIADT